MDCTQGLLCALNTVNNPTCNVSHIKLCELVTVVEVCTEASKGRSTNNTHPSIQLTSIQLTQKNPENRSCLPHSYHYQSSPRVRDHRDAGLAQAPLLEELQVFAPRDPRDTKGPWLRQVKGVETREVVLRWLVGWLVGWVVGWLVGWLVGWGERWTWRAN